MENRQQGVLPTPLKLNASAIAIAVLFLTLA
jgi:hypothetical protein